MKVKTNMKAGYHGGPTGGRVNVPIINNGKEVRAVKVKTNVKAGSHGIGTTG